MRESPYGLDRVKSVIIATQVALQYRWSHTGHIIKYTGTKGSYIDHVPTRYFLVQPPEKEVFASCMDKHLFPRVFSCLRVEERRTLTMCSKAKLGSYGAWSESACPGSKIRRAARIQEYCHIYMGHENVKAWAYAHVFFCKYTTKMKLTWCLNEKDLWSLLSRLDARDRQTMTFCTETNLGHCRALSKTGSLAAKLNELHAKRETYYRRWSAHCPPLKV